eukprot:CAMPEP_0195054424 /NCGR_PEP_ID=MMETSP0448-20130528/3375_1 /TAXON_ID=66468 /ORGANISM="Heterocapsa triquestra, Strain CCMP 448" /LENGTH=31 /DNA_ID= /DNA_START= /DNA_END= /DNA_ORIENTATION=
MSASCTDTGAIHDVHYAQGIARRVTTFTAGV